METVLIVAGFFISFMLGGTFARMWGDIRRKIEIKECIEKSIGPMEKVCPQHDYDESFIGVPEGEYCEIIDDYCIRKPCLITVRR